MTKQIIVIFFCILLFQNCKAQQNISVDAIQNALDNMQKDVVLQSASISFCMIDIEADSIIYAVNAQKSLPPASTLKLLTTTAALGILDSNFQYVTKIYYSGNLQNHVLNGDILIYGSGDPTLGSDRFKNQLDVEGIITQWVKSIQTAGIEKITGKVKIISKDDDKSGIPAKWLWEDIGNYYGAGSFSFNIHENYYTLFAKGNSVNTPASIIKTEPELKNLVFYNELNTCIATRPDSIYIFGIPYVNEQFIRGQLPANKKIYKAKGIIPNPSSYFETVFSEALVKSGIPIIGKDFTVDEKNLNVIDSISSASLKDIVFFTNFKSVNMYAESLLKTIGMLKKQSSATIAGTQAIKEYWSQKGIDVKGLQMYDGSGLSPSDAITTKQLAEILKITRKEPYFNIIYNSLPVAAKSGTLRNMGKGSPISDNLRAKTGHMQGVRSYAGYVTGKNGKLYSFAFIVYNYESDNYTIFKKTDEFLKLLYLE